MPLKLIPPGARKGNKFYFIRGMVDGQSLEVSTKTADRRVAKERLGAVERLLAGAPLAGQRVTFAQAIELYIGYRSPSRQDVLLLEKLRRVIGRKLVAEIRQVDLVDAANRLYPNLTPQSRNRNVLRAGAVLHYAARNGFCPWLRISLFKEPRPRTRAVAPETAELLLGETKVPSSSC